ncbi:MAG: GMC oxidoreductase [Alphaproteobacteria bacterium]|nr:GMC oxidoreductase [Alphaproteobacteria bacterium]
MFVSRITSYKYTKPHMKVATFLRWRLAGKGAGAQAPTPSGAFLKTRPDLEAPDIQLHFMTAMGAAHGMGDPMDRHGFQVHVCQLRPESRGWVKLASSDPGAHPRIQPNYLAESKDVETMREGIKIVRDIVNQPAFDALRGKEVWPGKDVQTDEEIDAALRERGETIYHPVGTCKMGHDDMAVVDDELRVHGLEGLRVVDASIMPTLIGGNTNAPTIMIAEKAADLIKQARKAPQQAA